MKVIDRRLVCRVSSEVRNFKDWLRDGRKGSPDDEIVDGRHDRAYAQMHKCRVTNERVGRGRCELPRCKLGMFSGEEDPW